MSLKKIIDEGSRVAVLKLMEENYRHAYELLAIEKLEGINEIQEAEGLYKPIMKLHLEYPKTKDTIILQKMGIDTRVDPICQELGYTKPERDLFNHIAIQISHCSVIYTPKKEGKIGKKIVNAWEKQHLKKIEEEFPEDSEEIRSFKTLIRFCRDRRYHDQMMNKFYNEIIPRLEEKLKEEEK